MCSVRGIGVADIASTSTSRRICRSSSFWATPNRCSSSTTTSPRLAGITSRESTRWVPTRTSTLPAWKPASAVLTSAGGRNRETISTRDREIAETLPEGRRVLLGEHRCRHQHQHLAPAGDRLQRRPHGDLGLAEADVAAYQPVHRPVALHVLGHRVDGPQLVVRLLVGERRLELRRPLVVLRERRPHLVLPARVEGQQLAGQLADGGAGPRPQVLPRLAAELRQRRRRAVGADVAADLAQLLVRDVQAVVAAELEVQVVADDAPHLLGVELEEPADAVILVDDVVAWPQVAEGGQRPAQPGCPARRAAAEQLPAGQHGQPQARARPGRGAARRRRSRSPARCGPASPGRTSSASTRFSARRVRSASPRCGKHTSTRYPARISARSSFSASAIPNAASAGGCASNEYGWPSGISSSAPAPSSSCSTSSGRR